MRAIIADMLQQMLIEWKKGMQLDNDDDKGIADQPHMSVIGFINCVNQTSASRCVW